VDAEKRVQAVSALLGEVKGLPSEDPLLVRARPSMHAETCQYRVPSAMLSPAGV
jgi:hypothetical protein